MNLDISIDDREWRAVPNLRGLARTAVLAVLPDDDVAIGLLFTSDARIAEMNGQWRGKAAELAAKLTALGADLPYMGGGKAIAGKLREGKGTLALFGLAIEWQATGGGHVYFLLKRR